MLCLCVSIYSPTLFIKKINKRSLFCSKDKHFAFVWKNCISGYKIHSISVCISVSWWVSTLAYTYEETKVSIWTPKHSHPKKEPLCWRPSPSVNQSLRNLTCIWGRGAAVFIEEASGAPGPQLWPTELHVHRVPDPQSPRSTELSPRPIEPQAHGAPSTQNSRPTKPQTHPASLISCWYLLLSPWLSSGTLAHSPLLSIYIVIIHTHTTWSFSVGPVSVRYPRTAWRGLTYVDLWF